MNSKLISENHIPYPLSHSLYIFQKCDLQKTLSLCDQDILQTMHCNLNHPIKMQYHFKPNCLVKLSLSFLQFLNITKIYNEYFLSHSGDLVNDKKPKCE